MLRSLVLLVCTLPTLLAHEGHHQAQTVLWHVLTEPDHLALLGLVLALVLGGAWMLLRRRRPAAIRDQA